MSRPTEKKDKPAGRVARWDPFADLEALERWSPFRQFAQPSGRLARLFESALGEAAGMARGFSPAVDIHEDEKQYTVTVELTGSR